MITKLTEQKGCIIAEFIDLKRFTLAVTEEVKSELKPILSQEGKLNSSYKCNGIHINNLFKFFVWCEVSKSFTRSII